MILTEQTGVAAAALPVAAFRAHLRLGTGFADAGLQDGLLESHLRAALAAVEARTGKILLARVFTWEVAAWRDGAAQALPVAPVGAVQSVVLVDRAGVEQVADAGHYRLVRDLHRPRLVATGACLPRIPAGGVAEVTFEAGFGPGWDDLPADLAQAVLLLAAEFYEHRHDPGLRGADALPAAVVGLVERWRNVRLLGGGA